MSHGDQERVRTAHLDLMNTDRYRAVAACRKDWRQVLMTAHRVSNKDQIISGWLKSYVAEVPDWLKGRERFKLLD
jgi:hypothetical protein